MCNCIGECGCNASLPIGQPGADGQDGAPGQNGVNGADGVSIAIRVTDLPDPSSPCLCGGILIEVGPDDGTGVPNPVTSSSVICNGCDGEDFNIPPGMVTMFYGDLSMPGPNFDATGLGVGILSGWAFLNGANGAPEMRGRFPVCTGQDPSPAVGDLNPTYILGSSGGENTHPLTTAELSSHNHGPGSLTTGVDGAHTHDVTHYFRNFDLGPGDAAATFPPTGTPSGTVVSSSTAHQHQVTSGTTANAGSGNRHENRPSYKALGFIYKL